MGGSRKWLLAVPLVALLLVAPSDALAQGNDFTEEGDIQAGFRIGFGQIPIAEPAGTFPIRGDVDDFLSDWFSAGTEVLFLTASGEFGPAEIQLIFYWDVFIRIHMILTGTEFENLQPYFRLGAGLASVDIENDSPYVDFAMPFAFGFDFWIVENVAFGLELATYVTGIAPSSDILPNNSVITPWMVTFGFRVLIH